MKITWIIFLLIWVLNKKLSKKDQFSEKTINQDAINLFYDTWDIESLHCLLYQQIEIHPFHEKYISKAYKAQLELLQGIEKDCRASIERTKIILKNKLENCCEPIEFFSIKKQFDWVLKKAPSIKEIFDHYSFRLYDRKSKKPSQSLYEGCQTIKETKKRFRSLALANHPDKGGCAMAMKEIIRQYNEYMNKFNHH